MAELFGSDGYVNMLTMIFGAVFALGGLMFRKVVANDMLDRPFSFIGCMALSVPIIIILDRLTDNLRMIVGFGLLAWLVGGFIGGLFLPDGESGGGGGE
jgi:hypothetical protein